jgi:diguanylate cyclase (GGDEF)-like protein/PAS domain S-box-containing protein
VLVVEDEAIVARDLERTLTRLGYESVGAVATGEDALARVLAARPDLVVMDIHLAGELDGIATAEQLRTRHGLPVVFLTAHSDEATFQRAKITEPYGYVLKPFEERELEIAVDIALYRHRVETKLAQMERWLATTLRSIGDAVLATDLAGTVTFMNTQAETLTGWSQTEARGQQLDDVLHLVQAADHAPLQHLVERVLREDMVIDLGPNALLQARNGRELPVDNSAAPIRDSAGLVSGFVIVLRDASAHKQTEDELRYSAVHDPLTGLANRALLLDRLRHAFEHARRRVDRRFAVLFVDLDDFKQINDRLGHGVGDQVLIGVARRLEGSLRGEDTVSRLGGDEFVILLDTVTDLRHAAHVAARIQQQMAAPMHSEGHEVTVGVSIGIALNGPNHLQAEDVMRDADLALYRAKALGKGRHVLSDPAQHQHAVRLLELEGELRRTAREHGFHIYYQPLVALPAADGAGPAGRLRGREALLRWPHPQRGLLRPADFLGLMEEMGLLSLVGDWVLAQACRQAQTWEPDLAVSVNLSRRQFGQPDLPEQVGRALAAASLEPARLWLDIPESALLERDAAEQLRRLHALGVQLYVDDFGQGATPLALLHAAPLAGLKIGPQLPLPGPDGRDLGRTAARLASDLGLTLVAEGLETAEQVERWRALGCALGQGFWLGEPAPAAEAGLAPRAAPLS